MLRIIGQAHSINVRKVLWTAEEIGLPYEREDLPDSKRRTPEFLALNPNGRMPVIIDDGFVLWESVAIVRYLAQEHGAGLLIPQEARPRALMEQWLGWQHGEVTPAWAYAYRALVLRHPSFGDRALTSQSINRWGLLMRVLERHLAANGPYAVGEAFSLADIALGVSVHRWLQMPFEKPAMPALDGYYALLKARPAAAVALLPGVP